MQKSLLRGAAAAVALFPLVTSQAMAAVPVAPSTTDPPEIGEIVVFGRGELKIGVAQAASEGTVAGSDLLIRPLLRVAELLEAVPGMVAAQHSGSGKANQYFLRGFNLDHGSDFTTYIDGVQMNARSHGHGHGYLDLNGLIPEIIDRQDYRKGPYRADGGDFALAGASYMSSLDGYDRPWAAGEIGAFGWKRAAAGGSAETGDGELTLVGQAKVYDGPWEEAERLRHYAAFAKYAAPISIGRLELSGHAYRGTWRPTEQIPDRIVGSAICPDVFCSPDPTAFGETTRFIANARLSGEWWHGNLYAQHYDWSMSSNPTYANADGSSAQILQFDKRWVFGLNAQRNFALAPRLELVVGTENRHDAVADVGVHHTDRGVFVESLGAYKLRESSAAAYAEATWRPVFGLRLTMGLRGDHYRLNVRAKDPEAEALGEGKGRDSLVSSKLMAAYQVSDRIELYANWGQGFHSNDVRGVVNRTTPVPTLVRGTGKEIGARFQLSRFTLTTTYWWLNVASELKFVGDSNAVEPSGASRRHGYEIVGFWRPRPWLAIDANYTASYARYDNGDYIPNAFDNAAQVGASVVLDRWEASLRMRHLGGYPLIEDNSVRDKGSTVFNTRAAFKPGSIELYAELLNILDLKDKDIAYYYESFIPGFDAAPVEGRLSRVVEPRTFRVGMKYNF